MTADTEYTLHLFEEREFRERFLPAVQGDEPIVRELLDAADAAGPSWTALHKVFDDTRVTFLQAVEQEDGEAALRSIFASFAQLLAHLRPVFCLRGFTLSRIDRVEFPELTSRIRSAGSLLVDDGGATLPGIPARLPGKVPATCLSGRSGGSVILREDVRPFLDQFRADLPRLSKWLTEIGAPAEEAVTMLLAALVEAKLKDASLVEAGDALVGDPFVPKTHRMSYARPDELAPAVVREAAKVFGRAVEAAAAPAKPAPRPTSVAAQRVPYSPRSSYEVGQRVAHATFGEGEVTRILDSRRMKVQFTDDEKVLVQGLQGPAGVSQRAPSVDDDGGE